MIKYDLNNRVAVVTGGAQGFGLAVTERFIDAGAKVVIWDIDEEAIKNAGYLNMVWVLLSLITLSFMCYMAIPEDSQTNTCPEPTSSSKLSTLPLVSFSDRPTSHNFGDYEDIGLHKPDRITEILVAYLLYSVIAIIFGVIFFNWVNIFNASNCLIK